MLTHADVWQKTTQCCKAIIPQLKINKLKNKNSIMINFTTKLELFFTRFFFTQSGKMS